MRAGRVEAVGDRLAGEDDEEEILTEIKEDETDEDESIDEAA